MNLNPADLFTVDDDDCATFHAHPTQSQFEAFAQKHPHTTSLSMSFEHPNHDPPPLDFSRIHLPSLTSLELACANVGLLQLTSDNTPSITSIDLHNLLDDFALRLELPELVSFDAEHSFVGGPLSQPNDFGLSLSRCPKLETVRTYKFRGLAGRNFCVCPCLYSLTLYRSECTDSLDILSAPALVELNVRAAYGMQHLRVRDFPGVTMEDAIALNAAEAAATYVMSCLFVFVCVCLCLFVTC